MKKRSNLKVMRQLIGLVKPLTGFMILAVLLGVIGFLCAIFITILGGWALLDAMQMTSPIPMVAAYLSRKARVDILTWSVFFSFLRAMPR